MKAVVTVLPELEHLRRDAVAAPAGGPGNGLALELAGELTDTLVESVPARDGLALVGSVGTDLRAHGTRGEVLVRLGGAHPGGGTLDAHLATQLVPVEEEGDVWVGVQLSGFAAAVLGEEDEAALAEALQQDHPNRRATGEVGRCHGDRLGHAHRLRGVLVPGGELVEGVGGSVGLEQRSGVQGHQRATLAVGWQTDLPMGASAGRSATMACMGSLSSTDLVIEAGDAVSAAADRSGVEVRALTTHTELAAASDLLTDVWKRHFPEDLLRAFELSGNFVAGAFGEDGTMVGASAGWASIRPEPDLHSHVTGVASSHRRTGVGAVLKLFQRWWALERDIRLVSWTFDPLLRRNARFNLSRLGATATGYLQNIYGDMDDDLNRHDESDRLWASWRLDEPDVIAAAAGLPRLVTPPPGTDQRLCPGPDGRPSFVSPRPGTSTFTCAVPADVESMRATDPELATQWRLAVREVLGGAVRDGGRVLGLDAAGDYVVACANAADGDDA